MTAEVRDKVGSTHEAYTADHLLELYRMCKDEASREEFIAMLTKEYQVQTETLS